IRSWAEWRVGLRRYYRGSTKEREVVYVGSTKISLKRAEYVAERHIHAFRFDAIDFQPKLRDVRAKSRQVVCQSGSLIRSYHHGESLRLQFIETGVAAILNEKLVATGVANTGHWRW